MAGQLVTLAFSKDLEPVRLAVLVSICDNATQSDEDEGFEGTAWPSHRRTAWKTGYSVRTVQRAEEELVETGMVLIIARPGKPSIYKVDLSKGKEKAPFIPVSKGGDRNHPTQKAEGGQPVTPVAGDKGVVTGDRGRSATTEVGQSLAHEQSLEQSIEQSLTATVRKLEVGQSLTDHTKPAQVGKVPLDPGLTVLEGRIGSLRAIPTSSGLRKAVFTVDRRPCKALGSHADGLLAKYKDGDYTHVEGYVENGPYGPEFVASKGRRLKTEQTTQQVNNETGFAVSETIPTKPLTSPNTESSLEEFERLGREYREKQNRLPSPEPKTVEVGA